MLTGANMSFGVTSFGQTSTITQGTTQMAELAYGAFHQRYKMCVPNCTTPTTTTDYLADPMTGMYSEKVATSSATIYSDYIVVPGAGIVAVRIKTGGTVLWRYAGVDHLGSVVTLTDPSLGAGAVTERNSYDPWGKRRNADGSDNTTCSITSQVSRGFTGQEMLDSVCMINMNARLYDPSVSRFMGADDRLPNLYGTVDHNRYSYTNNNPLNATDPSGRETVVVYGPWYQLTNCTDDCGGDIGYHDTADSLGFFDFGGDNADADRGGGERGGALHGHTQETTTSVNGVETLIEQWIPDDPESPPDDDEDFIDVRATTRQSACQGDAAGFTGRFGIPAQKLANNLHHGATEGEFLALGSVESDWFRSNSSRLGNNFFGVHNGGSPYPNQIGTYVTSGHNGVTGSIFDYWIAPFPDTSPQQAVSMFPPGEGFYDSGSIVVNALSALNLDYSDPTTFFGAVHDHGWAQGSSKPEYLSTMLSRLNHFKGCK
jgi:RHS repeat-associated protein